MDRRESSELPEVATVSEAVEGMTGEQRARIAALIVVQDIASVELDEFGLVRVAHWVATGRELP